MYFHGDEAVTTHSYGIIIIIREHGDIKQLRAGSVSEVFLVKSRGKNNLKKVRKDKAKSTKPPHTHNISCYASHGSLNPQKKPLFKELCFS